MLVSFALPFLQRSVSLWQKPENKFHFSFYDSLWNNCIHKDDDYDIQRIISEGELRKRQAADNMYPGGSEDSGGYFVKSAWMQDDVTMTKSRFDHTEKSVDKYLQAVLDK